MVVAAGGGKLDQLRPPRCPGRRARGTPVYAYYLPPPERHGNAAVVRGGSATAAPLSPRSPRPLVTNSSTADPRAWTREDAKTWLVWTAQQFSVPMSLLDLELWQLDGPALCGLTDLEWRHRVAPGREGETLYSQLEFWRTSSEAETSFSSHKQQQPPPYPGPGYWSPEPQPAPTAETTPFTDIAYMLQMLDHQNNPVGDPTTHYISPKPEPQFSPPPYMDPTEQRPSPAPAAATATAPPDPMEEDEGEFNSRSKARKKDVN